MACSCGRQEQIKKEDYKGKTSHPGTMLHMGKGQEVDGRAYLTHSAVPACFYVVFALIAGIDKAVLALCVQLHQHAQSGPFGAA